MDKIYDVIIFGGGVIGASIFNNLVLSNYKALLLEKGGDVAVGTSKANSAIVHAGFDAKPNTLKARFNVEGSKMFESVCNRLGLRLGKCGAYVIGNDINVVKELYNRGLTNGVEGLEILEKDELQKRLPNIADNITCGLYAKTSAIVCPYLLTICLTEEAIINGGNVRLNYDCNSVKYEDGIYVVSNGFETFKAKYLVNSTGNSYNDVAKLIGSEKYDMTFKRGEYFVLDKSEINTTCSTIFPLPSEHSKGILVTPTVDGNILVGPTSYDSDSSTKTTDSGLKEILNKSTSLLNNVNLRKAIRVFSGVRAVVGDDFVIELSKLKPNVVNLAGICSPGLSSAPAIAKYVISELLKFDYNLTKNNKNKLVPYTLSKTLPKEKLNELIKQNSDYGKVVCKCEDVTIGDIKMALNRPLKINSVDGVKRRVRAGMGRCQGGFCLDKVVSIIASENNEKLEDVVKENVGSNIVIGNIKE